MTLEFVVSGVSLYPIPCTERPRQGSRNHLKIQILFDESWDRFLTKTVYFEANGYTKAEMAEGEIAVDNFFTSQEGFQISVTGINGEELLPTNSATVTLDPSGDAWLVDPPDLDPTIYQQVVALAQEATAAANRALLATETDKTLSIDGKAADAKKTGDEFKKLKDGTGSINVSSLSTKTVSLENVYIAEETSDPKKPIVVLAGQNGDEHTVVRGVENPQLPQDATNKGYVDSMFSAEKLKQIVAEYLGDADIDIDLTNVPHIYFEGEEPSEPQDGDLRIRETEDGEGGDGGNSGSAVETDPTVPEWAKEPSKPTYTAAEVGAATMAEVNAAIADAINALGFAEEVGY